MADDSKPQNESFLRKVARFVANPTTDWKEINSRQDDPESELAKAELKAMIERKRRNDFVRKRELDMLRRLRREGLTPEQLAAAGAQNSSVISDAERAEGRDDLVAVKDKIDQIEQQMVKEGFRPSMVPRQPGGDFEPSTRAAAFAPTMPTPPGPAVIGTPSPPPDLPPLAYPQAPAAAVMGVGLSPPTDGPPSALPTLPALDMGLSFEIASGTAPAPSPPSFDLVLDSQQAQLPQEAQELGHDPELDEAVIAFANGDNETCERSLTELTQAGGPRNLHADTWLVRFDFYRATGQQAPFEALALEYVHLFGLSAPQWFSIPKLVAEGRKSEKKAPPPKPSGVSWSAPERLDLDALALMKKRCETAPLPWVLDWQAIQQIEPEALMPLTDQVRAWSRQTTEMRWLGGDRLLQLLRDQTPVGERDTDPGWWMLRLELLRVGNRPDQFDEAAIDYCVTYEVSPPSWEPARCKVRFAQGGMSTMGPSTNLPNSEGLGGFLESTMVDEAGAGSMAHLELSGQLVGDMTELLQKMTAQVGTAVQVEIACPKLVRLDFIAAGDLLNWVLQLRSDNRSVQFVDAHRLVALFFGAMGINEHARIKVRAV